MTKLYDDNFQENTLHYDEDDLVLFIADKNGPIVGISMIPVELVRIARKMLKIAERNIINI